MRNVFFKIRHVINVFPDQIFSSMQKFKGVFVLILLLTPLMAVFGETNNIIATYSPNGILDDYMGVKLRIFFDRPVTTSSGKIIIYSEIDEVIEEVVANSSDTFLSPDKTIFEYTPKNIGYGRYYVTIETGAFYYEDQELGVVPFKGIESTDKLSWFFEIIDWDFESSCYNIIEPLDGSVDQPTSLDLVLQFPCERIMIGSYGFLRLSKQTVGSDSSFSFEYLLDNSMVSIRNGYNALIVRVDSLEENTTYSVTISQGAVIDEAGNQFEGINTADIWNFTTGDFTPPKIYLPSVTVNNFIGKVHVTSNEPATIYLAEVIAEASEETLNSLISKGEAIKGIVKVENDTIEMSVVGLKEGEYKAYGFDLSSSRNMGVSANAVSIVDVPFLPVKEVQGQNDISPYIGQDVVIIGVVTAKAEDIGAYWIQDENEARSGIYVQDQDNVGKVEIGTGLEVAGTVNEILGLTLIENLFSFKYVAPVIVPAPIVLSTLSEEVLNDYESVLIEIKDVGVKSLKDSNNEWEVQANSGDVLTISDLLYELPDSLLIRTNRYDIKGVVYVNSSFKLAPRNSNDIIVLDKSDVAQSLMENLLIYPNPFSDYIVIDKPTSFDIKKVVIYNQTNQVVKEICNPDRNITTSDLHRGIYFISFYMSNDMISTARIVRK
jgi:hypothetical protein